MGGRTEYMAHSRPAQSGPGLLVDADATQRFEALFQTLDQDGNQVLSRNEIKAAMMRMVDVEQQEEPQPQGLQRSATNMTTEYINDLDLNGDGEVTREEWLQFWDESAKQYPQMTLEWYMTDVIRPSFGL